MDKKTIRGYEFNIYKGGIIEGDFICPDENVYFDSAVEVSGKIEVKRLFTDAGESIKAGEYIKAGEWIFSFTFEIKCSTLSTKRLPFFREFYSDMPPLIKWRGEILSRKCWDYYKNMLTKKEAEEVCAWEGWHWILKAQLEMFFGLKDEVKPPKL